MNTINSLKKRCFNHSDRESVALCSECKKTFCRECISSFNEKMACSICIQKSFSDEDNKKKSSFSITAFLFLIVSILFGWGAFYILAEFLVWLPSEFTIIE